jgi:hypothetical protein
VLQRPTYKWNEVRIIYYVSLCHKSTVSNILLSVSRVKFLIEFLVWPVLIICSLFWTVFRCFHCRVHQDRCLYGMLIVDGYYKKKIYPQGLLIYFDHFYSLTYNFKLSIAKNKEWKLGYRNHLLGNIYYNSYLEINTS